MSTLKTCSFDSAAISGNPAVTRLPSAHRVGVLSACICELLNTCFIITTEINPLFTQHLPESLTSYHLHFNPVVVTAENI